MTIVPNQEGIYLVRGLFRPESEGQIEVRLHPLRGLCCNANDYSKVRDFSLPIRDRVNYSDTMVPLVWTGLDFLEKVGDLSQ